MADIEIGFVARNHGDDSDFDGPRGVLAHAFYPQNGNIHFDEDEKWSLGRDGCASCLFSYLITNLYIN